MEAMATIVVLGVLALVAAIVAWVTWHRGADERQSVQHHQHALETLRQVADRRPPSGRSPRSERDGAHHPTPKGGAGATRPPIRRRGAAASSPDVGLEVGASLPSRRVAPP